MNGMRSDIGPGQENRTGKGIGGSCICPDCGYKEPHKRGAPCFQQRCPKCNKTLVREG